MIEVEQGGVGQRSSSEPPMSRRTTSRKSESIYFAHQTDLGQRRGKDTDRRTATRKQDLPTPVAHGIFPHRLDTLDEEVEVIVVAHAP